MNITRRKFLRGLAIGLPATVAAAAVAPLILTKKGYEVRGDVTVYWDNPALYAHQRQALQQIAQMRAQAVDEMRRITYIPSELLS